jgi:nicotinamide-nucleotide amidase
MLDSMTERIRGLVGDAFYGIGARTSLEERVAQLLLPAGRTVSTAESCTAGLLAERLTRISGSSDYFLGGVVTYSNELKQQLLGVSAATLEAHGAVSQEVVVEMAEGAVQKLGSDYWIGISGIAGPGGGTEEKPVGTVHVAVALRESSTDHRELHLPGGRQRVRWLARQWALDMLRRRLQ